MTNFSKRDILVRMSFSSNQQIAPEKKEGKGGGERGK